MLNITSLIISRYILLLYSPFYYFKSSKLNESASLSDKKKQVNFETYCINWMAVFCIYWSSQVSTNGSDTPIPITFWALFYILNLVLVLVLSFIPSFTNELF